MQLRLRLGLGCPPPRRVLGAPRRDADDLRVAVADERVVALHVGAEAHAQVRERLRGHLVRVRVRLRLRLRLRVRVRVRVTSGSLAFGEKPRKPTPTMVTW